MSLFEPDRGHILSLSDELLVLVLSLLPASDLITVSGTCTKLSRLARDKLLLRELSFRRDTSLTAGSLKQFLAGAHTCDKIRILNLNGVYWIQPSLIQSQLVKMKNLTELNVGDIGFTAKQFSSILTKLPTLTKLSFTWRWYTAPETREILKPELETFYSKLTQLHIFLAVGDNYPLDAVSQMLAKCNKLEQLVMFSEIIDGGIPNLSSDRYNISARMYEVDLPRLQTLVLDFKNLTMPELLLRSFKERFDVISKPTMLSSEGELYSSTWLLSNKNQKLSQLSLSISEQDIGKTFEMLEKYAEDRKLRKLLLYNPDPDYYYCEKSSHNVIHDIFKLSSNFFRNLQELNLHSYYDYKILLSVSPDSRTSPSCAAAAFPGTLCDPQYLENLDKLSLPICGYLDSDNTKCIQLWKQTLTANGFGEAVKEMKSLTHIEIKFCPVKLFNEFGAVKVVETLAHVPQLKSLVISNVGFQVNPSDSIFPKLFNGCENLRELHLCSLQTDPQKLFTSLERGLKSAKSLIVLKVFQKQFTQYSQRLLVAMKDFCKQLEQIIIVDPSNSFTLRRFPVAIVIELLTSLNKLRFLYLGSGLLTLEEVKTLKSAAKRITKTRPWLVARYQSRIHQEPFYSLEDVTELPMELQRSVATLEISAESQWSQSDVATVSVNQYF